MRDLFTKQVLTVGAGQVVSGAARQVQTLRVLQGRVWITVEGIAHDYWLSAGDTFTAIPGRLTVIEADRTGGRIDLAPSVRLPGMFQSLAALLARLARRRTVSASFKRHGTCGGSC